MKELGTQDLQSRADVSVLHSHCPVATSQVLPREPATEQSHDLVKGILIHFTSKHRTCTHVPTARHGEIIKLVSAGITSYASDTFLADTPTRAVALRIHRAHWVTPTRDTPLSSSQVDVA